MPSDPSPATTPSPAPRRSFARTVWRYVWQLKYVLLALAILAGSAYLLQALGPASALLAPPVPTYTPEPPDQQEMIVLGPDVYAPGTQGACRVVAWDPRALVPLSNVEVSVALAPVGRPEERQDLFQGTTGSLGTVDAAFEVPAVKEGAWSLVVEASGEVGTQRIERPIEIRRNSRVDLLTDKRIYSSGEAIQAWFRVAEVGGGRGISGQPVNWMVRNAHGDRVCAGESLTADNGTGIGTCVLADRVAGGTYHVIAHAGEVSVVREVVVDTEPVFSLQVEASFQESYYLPDQTLVMDLLVTDRAGMPVPGAHVEVREASAGDTDLAATGVSDEDGLLALSLPHRASGGLRRVPVVVSATDAMSRTGTAVVETVLSDRAIVILAQPEAGLLEPGIENKVWIRASYPDGRPARCTIAVDVPALDVHDERTTDAMGEAWLTVVPPHRGSLVLDVEAEDSAGQTASERFELAVRETSSPVLVRTERSLYRPGEAMRVHVYAPDAAHAVYLDYVLEGQLVVSWAAPLVDGQAILDATVPEGLSGRVRLDAYTWTTDGMFVRGSREVTVLPAGDVQVSVRPLDESLIAGEQARLALRVQDTEGSGSADAVVLAAVQEELDPGQTTSQVAATVPPTLVPPTAWTIQRADPVTRALPVDAQVLDGFEAYQETWAQRNQAFSKVAGTLWWALGLLSVVFAVPEVAAIWREGRGAVGSLLVGLVVAVVVWILGVVLVHLADWVLGIGERILFVMGCAGALLALLIEGMRRWDGWAVVRWALVVSCLSLTVGLQMALARGGAALDVPVWLVASGTVLPVVLLCQRGTNALRGVVDAEGRRVRSPRWSVAATALALAVLFAYLWAHDAASPPDPRVPVEQALPSTEYAGPLAPGLSLELEDTRIVPQLPAPSLPSRLFDAGATVYWAPDPQLDADGALDAEIGLSDEPGNVRFVALAIAGDGAWGLADVQQQTYLPLETAIPLPSQLTVGDRLELPLSVQNGLSLSQTVQLTVSQASWFRLQQRGADVHEVSLPGNGQALVVVPLEAREWGDHVLTVTVQGETWSDVLTRTVHVQPDALFVSRAYSWWIGDWVRYKFRIPWSAVRGTDQIAISLHTGPQSVLVEGLARGPQMLGGSFDQVAAALETRLLQVAWLRRMDGWLGDERADLERELSRDYQRLLAFKTEDGGFSAFGTGESDLYRTAYALRCLSGLSTVLDVDPDLLDQVSMVLIRQEQDGAWYIEGGDPSWLSLTQPELLPTAYVTWSLIDAGYGEAAAVRRALDHLSRYVDQAQDPYCLSLVVHALISSDEPMDGLDAALARLVEQARVEEGVARWVSRVASLSGAVGGDGTLYGYQTPSIDVETSALATYALARAGVYPERVQQGLARLTDSRDVVGTWNAPQATVLALKAFLTALPDSSEPVSTTVSLSVGENHADPVALVGDARDQVVFDELAKGYNDVVIAVEGDTVGYQIVGSYYLPWSQVPPPLPEEEDLSVEAGYERTELAVGEIVPVSVHVVLNRPGRASIAVVQLGLPPGLSPILDDLQRLVAQGDIGAYELDGANLCVYVTDLVQDQPVRFTYRLQALYPVSVSSGPVRAFDVANPQRPAVRAPVRIQVRP